MGFEELDVRINVKCIYLSVLSKRYNKVSNGVIISER
jgi:hypothetical protein